MTNSERKTTMYLSSIYVFRMLGLFMILPVFSLYTQKLQGANTILIGVALGIYGLTQAIFQIPFGMSSDRIGRKPVIIFGLILFMAGSIIAATSHGIYGIIIGRALQGAGAIGSTLIALVADTTQEQHRLKAMAMIGMSIGFSFMVAMVLGPVLNSWVGLSGIFWFTAILSVIGILIITLLVPTPKNHLLHRDSEPVLNQFKKILKNKELLRLNFGIFSLHATLMASFIAVPMILVNNLNMSANHQWIVYLPVLVIAFVLMMPFVIIAEAKRKMKPLFVMAISLLALTQILLVFFHKNLFIMSTILCLFFTAFTFLESSLPSLISKIVPAGSKGTAMGIYSSAQFLGVFFGASVGGLVFSHFGVNGLFAFCASLCLIWNLIASTMKQPPYLSSKIISLSWLNSKELTETLQKDLLQIKGIFDVVIYLDEHVAYLKVDKKLLDEAELNRYLDLQKQKIKPLKLITLNIWGGHVYEPLIAFAKAHQDIDIFCLQEVYHQAQNKISDDGRKVHLDILNKLIAILPNHKVFFRPVVNNNYGIAMLVKKDLQVITEGEVRIHENPDYPGHGADHPRNLQWLEFRSNDKVYNVINVHGLWNGKGKTDTKSRIEQSKCIKTFMDNLKTPKILCGDFNLRPDTKSLKLIEEGMYNQISLHNITSTRTRWYPKEERFADYVFTSKEIHVKNFEVLPDEVSDHAAILLEFI